MDRTVSISPMLTTARPRCSPVFQAGCFWVPTEVGAVGVAGVPGRGISRGVPSGQTCRRTEGTIARREPSPSLSGLLPEPRRKVCRPARSVRPCETDSRLARGGRGSGGTSTKGRHARMRGPCETVNTGQSIPFAGPSTCSSRAGDRGR